MPARMMSLPIDLAREQLTWDDAVEIILWGSVVIVAIIACWLAMLYMRRRIYYKEQAKQSMPWTLDGARELRNRGMIDEDEFQRMRSAIVASLGMNPASQAEATDAGSPDGTGDELPGQADAEPSKEPADGDDAPEPDEEDDKSEGPSSN